MNRQLVENILGVLKMSTDETVILKVLIKLRTNLVKDRSGIVLFREAGGIQPMLRFLNKPHEQILETALSILANCMIDERSCKEALDCKISVPLAIILKSIVNPVIQCRACRLLGNLAKCDAPQLLATHCPSLAQSVCQIIDETSDVQTRIMAYRACRFLLTDPQFLKLFLQAYGFVSLLRILFALMKKDISKQEEALCETPPIVGLKQELHREKYFEEVARNLEGVRSDIFDSQVLKNLSQVSNAYAMPEEKAALDLACEILKCLLVMSELHINSSIWEKLNRSNCSFEPIVFFMTTDNKHRSVALKILSNFTKNSGAFNILSAANAIVVACDLIVSVKMEKALSVCETRHCINVICMMSADACNRSKIRRSGTLRKLIAMVRDSQSQTEISSILHILNNFQYDSISMDLMLRDGLIPVLIKELDNYLTSNDEHHKRKREEKQQSAKKRKLPDEYPEPPIRKIVKVRDEPLIDYDSPSSSPKSYFSPSSPCSSRSMSPVGCKLFKLDDCAEDATYSPVCSDDEEETDNASSGQGARPANLNNANNTDYSDIMKLLDIACRTETVEENVLDKEDEDDISQDEPNSKLPQNLPRSTIDIIENLLYRVTLLINKRGELGKPSTFNALIKAIQIFGGNNNFSGTLTNILLESQFFGEVVRQGIVHQLFELSKTQEVRSCGLAFLETLTCVAESNYGKGELARLLRCDDEASQNRAAIAVAYVIKSQRLLFQFLNDGNALTLLLNIILGKRNDYTAEACDALTAMSKNTLGITMPKMNAGSSGDHAVFEETETLLPHTDCDICFVIHDPQNEESPPITIKFSKQILCETSEVFNTMLNSDFRESNEREIHMSTCTASGLRYFLNLIVRQSQKLQMSAPPAHQYQALLEAFEMSRIYIIPEMEEFTQQLLISQLDATNCFNVLEWSMKNYHAELTEMAINYFLCSTLSTDEKVSLFRNAEYSSYATEWFQMIFDAVLGRCRNGF